MPLYLTYNSMERFVIVADDDQLVIDRAQTVIEQEGFIPVVAHDGKRATKPFVRISILLRRSLISKCRTFTASNSSNI